MKFIYDFGVSQEDFKTEQAVLNIKEDDKILCVASGGELPLNLLCTNTNVRILAVDISAEQIFLSRLKLKVAANVEYPNNGYFLGYGKMNKDRRKDLFDQILLPLLEPDEIVFWNENFTAIEHGVVSAGRFELYMKRMRILSKLVIGKKNLQKLIDCKTIEEQKELFHKNIATRRSIQYLFKIAFHPYIYKNRGLNSQGLMYANADTGKRYFKGFENFCTATPAATNFFLQYFLSGNCKTPEAFPEYLHEANRKQLAQRAHQLTFKQASLTDVLQHHVKGAFNKIHLSNIGDWLSEVEFKELLKTCEERLNSGAVLCYRFLQKNQFAVIGSNAFTINNCTTLQEKDRFPFYSILSITFNE